MTQNGDQGQGPRLLPLVCPGIRSVLLWACVWKCLDEKGSHVCRIVCMWVGGRCQWELRVTSDFS